MDFIELAKAGRGGKERGRGQMSEFSQDLKV